MQLKITKAEVELKKAQGTMDKASANKALAKVKQAKLMVSLEAKQDDAVNRRRMLTLAANIGKRIKKHWSGKIKKFNELQEQAVKLGPEPTEAVTSVKKATAPVFFTVIHSALRNVAHKGWDTTGAKKKKQEAQWISRDFVPVVYNGPINEAKSPDLKTNLRTLIKETLPGYSKFLGAGFNVDSLMQQNNCVADLCFLEAVWRYTRCVGLENFPCGLDTWPPIDTDDVKSKKHVSKKSDTLAADDVKSKKHVSKKSGTPTPAAVATAAAEDTVSAEQPKQSSQLNGFESCGSSCKGCAMCKNAGQ